MKAREAESLLANAIPSTAGVWADLGAGEGILTRVLLGRLGPGSRVYAIDRDRDALASIAGGRDTVIPVVADIAHPFELPDRPPQGLDGILLANVLHYFRDPARLLGRFVAWLRPRGRVVIVEYDGRRANRWVPYPIPRSRLSDLARSAGLSAPTITASRPSAYGGTIYVAVADR